MQSFSIFTCLAHFSVTVNWILYFNTALLSLYTLNLTSLHYSLCLPSTCHYLDSHVFPLFLSFYPPLFLITFPSSQLIKFVFHPPFLPRSWAVWCWRCCLKISQSSSQQRCRWCGPNWWEQCTGMWQAPTQRWAGSRFPAQQCEEFGRRRGKKKKVSIARSSVRKVSQTLIRLTW